VANPDTYVSYGSALNANYQHSVQFASDVQQSYRSFLVTNAAAAEGFGLLMIGAGGAALGVAAASTGVDTSLAITELGIGGGTLLGGALWLQNKPKLNAYLVGISADQCVIDNAVLLQPSITRAGRIREVMDNLRPLLASFEPDIAAIIAAGKSLTPDQQTQKDAVTNAKQALADGQSALAAAELAGPLITRSVQDIDTRVFSTGYKGEPDIAALSSNFTSLQKIPFSPNAAPPAKGLGGAATPFSQLVEATNELQNLVGGLTLATKDFASSCLTDLNQGIAQALLQVLPSNNITCQKGTACTLTVMGGRPPYVPTRGDTGLIISTNPAGSVTIYSVTVSDTAVHTLLISDLAGSTLTVTITGK